MLYPSPMKIGELSKTSGVAIDTIRYYEKRGLIPPPARTVTGYRDYGRRDLARLKFIVQAKNLGFTLEEIGQLLTLRSTHERSCAEVRMVAESKAAEIAERIEQLTRIRRTLLDLAEQCGQSSADDPCPILKSMEEK